MNWIIEIIWESIKYPVIWIKTKINKIIKNRKSCKSQLKKIQNENNLNNIKINNLIRELRNLKNSNNKEICIRLYLSLFSNNNNFIISPANLHTIELEKVFKVFNDCYGEPQLIGIRDNPMLIDFEMYKFKISPNDREKINDYLEQLHPRFIINDLLNKLKLNKENDNIFISNELKKLFIKPSKKFSNELQSFFIRKKIFSSRIKNIYQFNEAEKEIINETIEKLEKNQ